MVYFARSYFDDLVLQRYILRSFFFLLQKEIVKKSPHKKFLHIYFCSSFFRIFIFAYLIKMTI